MHQENASIVIQFETYRDHRNYQKYFFLFCEIKRSLKLKEKHFSN